MTHEMAKEYQTSYVEKINNYNEEIIKLLHNKS